MPWNDPESFYFTVIEGEWFWLCPEHRKVPFHDEARRRLLAQSSGMVKVEGK
jgi:hypothetical protein